MGVWKRRSSRPHLGQDKGMAAFVLIPNLHRCDQPYWTTGSTAWQRDLLHRFCRKLWCGEEDETFGVDSISHARLMRR